ncbi:MAG: ABC transporter permease subunit, partial [Fusicatenibacter sp.]|nr:ABC transporter permease subunit [Fusicatenibacter sp.]
MKKTQTKTQTSTNALRPRNSFVKRLWKDRTLVLMALPAVVLMIMFSYIPMTGLVLAFKKFDFKLGLYKSPWNGLENFKHLFLVGNTFWRMTRNTVGYYILFTVVGTVCQIALAIAVHEMVFKKYSKTVQCIMILPTFISAVALRYIVSSVLSLDIGTANKILISLGKDQINFYMEPKYWPLILTIVSTWKGTGYGSVLYLSVLAGIDGELYDAASVDGASAWQRIRYITLPSLLPMVSIRMLLGLGSIMHSDTGLFFEVTKNTGALYPTTQVIDSYLLGAI